MKIEMNAKFGAVLLGGVVLGWMVRSVWGVGRLSVTNLSARDITLVDGSGHKRAEFKADSERTSLVFFDGFNRPRLTLNLDQRGPSTALQGVEDGNKIVVAVNDPLRTASIYASAFTSAINVVGTEEARFKLSDSVFTDARSASLSIGPRVTKLRLSSNGAESELWAKNELASAKADTPRSAELDLRTAKAPGASLRISSEDQPSFELWSPGGSKICGCPLPQR